MFVRHTEGVSWRPAPGVRRWSSTTVGGHTHHHGLLWLLAWLFFIGPLWLIIECDLLVITAAACLVAAFIYRLPPAELHWRRAGWFWLFDIDLPGGR